jgi:hypothetical protein
MIINCTPHNINVFDVDGNEIVIPPCGSVARCTEEYKPTVKTDNIQLYYAIYGSVVLIDEDGTEQKMPAYDGDTWYIVSRPVRMALFSRMDLLSPGELIRDGNGRVIGCKGFTTN